MTAADRNKRAAAEAAVDAVTDGMAVGLGTGSTAAFFVRALGVRARERGWTLRCVSTSETTAVLARETGLELRTLEEVGALDLTVDGADEVGPGLALIKGGGGALLREKLVWAASRRCVCIADAEKRVDMLGRFDLPVEVVAFAHASTAERIARAAADAGVPARPALRRREGVPFRTDEGHVMYDLPCGRIPDPEGLAAALKAVVGVVEHGLFLHMADEALIGSAGGADRITA